MSTTSPSGANSSSDAKPAGGAGEEGPAPVARVLEGKYEVLETLGETQHCFLFRGRLVEQRNGGHGGPPHERGGSRGRQGPPQQPGGSRGEQGPPDGPDAGLAIKFLKERYAQDRDFVERYASELRTTANLPPHPGLLKYYAVDTISKRFCVIAEYFESQPLETLLAGVPDYPLVLAVLRQLSEVLELGLREGLMTRNIRHEDVLVQATQRRLKLQRFGQPRTGTGRSGGSSPAIATARKPSGPGPDLLFLGVTLYRLMTGGKYPFPGRDEVAEAVAEGLAEASKIRYATISGPEIEKLCKLFVGTTTREMSRRLESYEDVRQQLDELEKANEAVQSERRRVKKQQALDEESTERGSAFDAVALLTGQAGRTSGTAPGPSVAAGRDTERETAADRAALRELARPLESQERPVDPDVAGLDEEPGGLFSLANLAIGACAVLLIALIYRLFYR